MKKNSITARNSDADCPRETLETGKEKGGVGVMVGVGVGGGSIWSLLAIARNDSRAVTTRLPLIWAVAARRGCLENT